jgi:hypothetical protein
MEMEMLIVSYEQVFSYTREKSEEGRFYYRKDVIYYNKRPLV